MSTITMLHYGQGRKAGKAGAPGNACHSLMSHKGALTDEELLQACTKNNATADVAGCNITSSWRPWYPSAHGTLGRQSFKYTAEHHRCQAAGSGSAPAIVASAATRPACVLCLKEAIMFRCCSFLSVESRHSPAWCTLAASLRLVQTLQTTHPRTPRCIAYLHRLLAMRS
jgi:hypothetical protein